MMFIGLLHPRSVTIFKSVELVLPKEPMRAYSREYSQDAGLVKSVELVLPKEPRSVTSFPGGSRGLSQVNVTSSGQLSRVNGTGSAGRSDAGLVKSVELVLPREPRSGLGQVNTESLGIKFKRQRHARGGKCPWRSNNGYIDFPPVELYRE